MDSRKSTKLTTSILGLEIEIPKKKYFQIGEVSDLFGIETHTLRYWEEEFEQLAPLRRRGTRNYISQDLAVIFEIKTLTKDRSYTIQGAKNILTNDLDCSFDMNNLAINQEIQPKIENLLKELDEFTTYINKKYLK